jgi:putative hemolysin
MNSTDKPLSDLRIAAVLPNTLLGKILKPVAPLLDKLLGIDKLQSLYLQNNLSGLEKQTFSEKLLALLGVRILGAEGVLAKIPQTGRCIVVCNHPYGMIEGVIIAKLLTAYRTDTKIMANLGLRIFKEINDYFIFANPLQPKAPINTTAIKQCFSHIENDGLLVIFPAGRVSFFQSEKQRITDAQWNRLAVQIAVKKKSPILPVFISGTNSALFHKMGQVYFRFRLLMLAREMFKLQQHRIDLITNNLIKPEQLGVFNGIEKMNEFVRLQCYLNDDAYLTPWLEDDEPTAFKDIIPTANKVLMSQELSELPEEQRLVDFKSFSVYYGYQHQVPTCVQEITRLREITFRELNEGSGEACDTDHFDATYMHLFIFDHQNEEIIGAYRIGQTDLLQKDGDVSKLYLSQMFNFQPNFVNQQQPCLEMGRSFIVEAHQNSFHGLLLLWKGIGAYVCKNPRYRTLYGTVSLSKLYDPRSVAVIDEVVVTQREGVEAKSPFKGNLHPEAFEFLASNTLALEQLSALVEGIEADGKDVPVLLKQYYKLGAKFHCIGIDDNFNHTPGLLLSVDLPSAPDKLLKLYLGKNRQEYLAYSPE